MSPLQADGFLEDDSSNQTFSALGYFSVRLTDRQTDRRTTVCVKSSRTKSLVRLRLRVKRVCVCVHDSGAFGGRSSRVAYGVFASCSACSARSTSKIFRGNLPYDSASPGPRVPRGSRLRCTTMLSDGCRPSSDRFRRAYVVMQLRHRRTLAVIVRSLRVVRLERPNALKLCARARLRFVTTRSTSDSAVYVDYGNSVRQLFST